MTQTDAVKRAVAKYDKTHTIGIYIKLHKEKDKDIIDKLSTVESKQGYIKNLILKDIMENATNNGQWIPNPNRSNLFNCSNCGALSKTKKRICTNCNAKMKG